MTEIRSLGTNEELIHKKRIEITNKAIKLFLRKGFDRVTTHEIAKACNMATGGIYRYIGAKDDILHLIATNSAIEMQQFVKLVGHPKNNDLIILLKNSIKHYFILLDAGLDANLFCNREMLHFSHVDRQTLLKTQEEFVAYFEEILKQGMKNGIFKVKNPNLVAHNIVVLGFDWCLRNWYLKTRYSLSQYTKLQTELILQNVLPSDE